MAFHVIIPARLQSTRLPAKPLADLGGRPMVVRVAERAARAHPVSLTVATDAESVAAACQAHGWAAILTASDHPTGTDRLAEAVKVLNLAPDDIVVNVQGDEPLIDPSLIGLVAQTLASQSVADIATAAHRIDDASTFFDANVVKVVLATNGLALYFSRAPIPYARDAFTQSTKDLPPALPALRHIGIYAYRVRYLQAYSQLTPTAAERFESLEQLRALEHGYRIAVAVWPHAVEGGVDTEADLLRVRKRFL
jgi:3-deoxy-manno-octulosonate cytidylyltransferase (CMP-KDO synthetase)